MHERATPHEAAEPTNVTLTVTVTLIIAAAASVGATHAGPKLIPTNPDQPNLNAAPASDLALHPEATVADTQRSAVLPGADGNS